MKKRLTIKDIALLSGVGKSTVSRVLNHEGHVDPRTREHVLSVIQQHGFTPSKSARAMRNQSDKVIAIIVTRLDSPSENRAVRTMLPLFYQQGFDPIVMESQFDSELTREHLNVLAERNIDGIILFGYSGLDTEMLNIWQSKMVIMVREYPGFSSVCYDDHGAVALLMEHLSRQGHRQISYLGVNQSDTTTGARRYQAYLSECHQRRITPHAVLGELSYQSAFQQVAGAITAQTTALICATDNLALGAIKYLTQNACSLQVCSVGSTPLLNFLFPQTLTVEPGYEEAGLQAAQQLLGQLNGQRATAQIIIPVKLPE